ncbi:hypothetical protein V3C99_009694 [Haemonchus contortus]
MLLYVFFVALLLSAFTQQAVVKEVKEACEDRSRACKGYKENGYCDSTDEDKVLLMKANCKKTCGLCSK